jgi:hypothetical protein
VIRSGIDRDRAHPEDPESVPRGRGAARLQPELVGSFEHLVDVPSSADEGLDHVLGGLPSRIREFHAANLSRLLAEIRENLAVREEHDLPGTSPREATDEQGHIIGRMFVMGMHFFLLPWSRVPIRASAVHSRVLIGQVLDLWAIRLTEKIGVVPSEIEHTV